MSEEPLIESAKASLKIRPESALLYLRARDAMLAEVNARLAAHPQIQALIGGNPLATMHDNHRHHVDFIGTVLQFGSFALLVHILPWVYRTYRAHGFSLDYFPLELEAWRQAVRDQIADADAVTEIVALYDWILDHHPTLSALADRVPEVEPPHPELGGERRAFGTRLLAGDHAACLTIARSVLAREQGQSLLYLGLIQPVMEEIGRLWEQDRISTAEEHLATALVGRILAALYAELPLAAANRGRAVVTCAPNEYHELGGRMLADLLEAAGWDVLFLGSNTPVEALLDLLGKRQPRFLAISLTMPFGLGRVAEIISRIRATPELAGIRVLVGGAAFKGDPRLWRRIGADAWAEHPQAAVAQAAAW